MCDKQCFVMMYRLRGGVDCTEKKMEYILDSRFTHLILALVSGKNKLDSRGTFNIKYQYSVLNTPTFNCDNYFLIASTFF